METTKETTRGICEEPCLITDTGIVPIRDINRLHVSADCSIVANVVKGYGVNAYVSVYILGRVDDQEHGGQAIRNIHEQFRAALRLSKEGKCFDVVGRDLIPAKR
jgi:hypothetical protein